MSYPHYSTERACQDSLTPLLVDQHAWSQRTFGTDPRPAGVIDHIKRELVEIEGDPSDVVEWIDVALLAFDGALRQGHSPREVVDALFEKARENRLREWPALEDQDPNRATEHVREQFHSGACDPAGACCGETA